MVYYAVIYCTVCVFRCNAMSIQESVPFFYPRLIPLHDVDVDSTELPIPIRCSYERLKENGVYLLGKLGCLEFCDHPVM